MIGDVSGKGVPAALFMAVSRTLLRAAALRGTAPGECLAEVNRVLLRDAASSLFVTIFYGVLDPATGTLAYSNGGHNPPFVVRGGGGVERLPARGLPVGTLAEATYATGDASLRPGDVLFLYTDGVTEAMNAADEQFTTARLQQAAGTRQPIDARDPDGRRAGSPCGGFTGDAPQSDDLTALVVRHMQGKSERPRSCRVRSLPSKLREKHGVGGCPPRGTPGMRGSGVRALARAPENPSPRSPSSRSTGAEGDTRSCDPRLESLR